MLLATLTLRTVVFDRFAPIALSFDLITWHTKEQNVQLNNGMPGTTVKRPFYGLTLSPAEQAQLSFPMSSTTVPVSTINYFPHAEQSNYHALTGRLERRFHAGVSLLNSFTWSKAITNAPQYRTAGGITGSENSPPP